jgi:hypothetical protein
VAKDWSSISLARNLSIAAPAPGNIGKSPGCSKTSSAITIAAGNVVEGKMLDIWKKEKYRKLRSRMLKGHCPHCWLSCSFDWQQFVKSESMVEEFWQSRLTNPET